MSIEDIKSGRWLDCDIEGTNPREFKDYRSISDPSVVYYEGKWILYPSYSLAYITEDFIHWKHVDIGVPNVRYSPAIVEFRGKWYLSGHGMSEVYVAEHPLGPFNLCGRLTDVEGREMKVLDPCYLADGDHLYLYWFGTRQSDKKMDVEVIHGTLGAELNPEEPWKLLTEPVWLNEFEPSVTWQCVGEHNQNKRLGWIEGQWMIKIDHRYYLLYSGSGTPFGSYANGVAISEEGPLSGFVSQKNTIHLLKNVMVC